MPQTPSHTPDPVVRQVTLMQPLQWLGLAWRDMERAPLPGLLHGLVFTAVAAVALLVARQHFWLLAGAFSGFLLVAPILATGLYAISRALEQGKRPGFGAVVAVWQSGDRRLIGFGLLLALAGTGWVLTSAALITLLASQPVTGPADFIRHVVLDRQTYLFEFWLALGGIMAAPIFASSVVTIPLLLDRRATVLQAVLTSCQAVLVNPTTLAVWAALIMGFTVLGLASLMIGLVVVIPILGHASWHAYRDLVDTSSLVERLPPKEAP